MDLNVIITTNGPGEIAAWVKPVVESLRSQFPQVRIIIALVPCPHSSGFEAKIGSQIHGTTVLLPHETVQFILTGRLPAHIALAQKGVILHLGGDQLFSVSLGWRSHFPVVVYTEDQALWKRFVQKYLLRDENLYYRHRRRINENKLSIVGDIMADAVRPTLSSAEVRQKLNLNPHKPVVSLLPGSKPLKVRYTTSWMLKIADLMHKLNPDIQFILPQSPFTPLSQLREAVQNEQYRRVLGGVSGKIVHDRNSTFIVTPEDNCVQIIPPTWHYNALQISDLSLTLPGTNTAELAIMGVPMIVLLPLDRPEVIPLDGVAGAISRFPLLGPWLKKQMILARLKKMKYIALPNMKAGYQIVPELIGQISPHYVAEMAQDLLHDAYYRREIGFELRSVMTSENAVEHVIEALQDVIRHSYKADLMTRSLIWNEDTTPSDFHSGGQSNHQDHF